MRVRRRLRFRVGVVAHAARPSIALAIVVVSVLGAIVGYQGTVAGQRSADEEWRAIADLTVRAQIATASYGHASSDVRALTMFEQSQIEARELRAQASRIAASQPDRARDLRAHARSLEILLTGELWVHERLLDPEELEGFDVERFRSTADGVLKDFHGAFDPDAHEAASAAAGRKATRYHNVAVGFAVAFFFLSLAELTRRRMRVGFAVAGLAVALAAVGAWVTT